VVWPILPCNHPHLLVVYPVLPHEEMTTKSQRYNCFTRNRGNAIHKHAGPETKGSNPTTGLNLLWARNPFMGNFNHWQVSQKGAVLFCDDETSCSIKTDNLWDRYISLFRALNISKKPKTGFNLLRLHSNYKLFRNDDEALYIKSVLI